MRSHKFNWDRLFDHFKCSNVKLLNTNDIFSIRLVFCQKHQKLSITSGSTPLILVTKGVAQREQNNEAQRRKSIDG